MENILNYELNYRIKGEKLKRVIDIDFVPNIRHKEARQIQELVFQVQAKWNNIKMLEQEIELLKSDKDAKKLKDAVDAYTIEIKSLENEIKLIGTDGIIERRINLVRDILKDNGIKDTDEIMNYEFWDSYVEPKDINDFIDAAINKDISKKKQGLK